MRIIGGIHGGRVLKVPPGLPVRPTTDFAKSALFNILNNRLDFEGLKVLDLFSGTGNITLEFASREAASVTSVDENDRCVRFLQTESEKLKLNNVNAIKADVFRYLQQKTGQYDLIFADPPYESLRYPELLNTIVENKLLAEDGWLIIEHSKQISFEDAPLFKEERSYGNVHFSFFSFN